jgi:hypothetical protein
VFLLATTVSGTSAPNDPASVCDGAAQRAARETGVPVQILRAITRTETGRTLDGTFGPWPWTVNHAGRGLWFEQRAEALGYITAAQRDGARNFDVGCFQINYHWHGDAFTSLVEMLDPDRNARYAAHFLTRLRDELGDWERAVGAFHSRTPEFAARYMTRYRQIHAALSPPSSSEQVARQPHRAPQGLDVRPRAPLFFATETETRNAASLFRSAPARPLWEAHP